MIRSTRHSYIVLRINLSNGKPTTSTHLVNPDIWLPSTDWQNDYVHCAFIFESFKFSCARVWICMFEGLYQLHEKSFPCPGFSPSLVVGQFAGANDHWGGRIKGFICKKHFWVISCYLFLRCVYKELRSHWICSLEATFFSDLSIRERVNACFIR